MTNTNEDYIREIKQSQADGQLTDGMLDIMEAFVNAEGDRRIMLGFPFLPEHRDELVDDTIAMFESGLLEMQVMSFDIDDDAKNCFASKVACAFSNVTNKQIWGR